MEADIGRSRSVVPGGVGKLLVYSLRTVPRWAKTRILKLVMGGMTAHQRAKDCAIKFIFEMLYRCNEVVPFSVREEELGIKENRSGNSEAA